MTVGRWTIGPLLAVACLSGCKELAPSRNAEAVPTVDAPRVPTGSTRAVTPPSICGIKEGALPSVASLQALGRATTEASFRLSEPITEFRVKLLNHFKLPHDEATLIKEQTWSTDDCRLTVWFTAIGDRWQPIEYLRWSAGDEF